MILNIFGGREATVVLLDLPQTPFKAAGGVAAMAPAGAGRGAGGGSGMPPPERPSTMFQRGIRIFHIWWTLISEIFH